MLLMTLTGTGFSSFCWSTDFPRYRLELPVHWWHDPAHNNLQPCREGRAQATNDMTIFVVGLVYSLSAGALLQAFGWQVLNLLLLPWLAFTALALIWFGYKRRRGVESVALSTSHHDKGMTHGR